MVTGPATLFPQLFVETVRARLDGAQLGRQSVDGRLQLDESVLETSVKDSERHRRTDSADDAGGLVAMTRSPKPEPLGVTPR